jgi:hypothetical protein
MTQEQRHAHAQDELHWWPTSRANKEKNAPCPSYYWLAAIQLSSIQAFTKREKLAEPKLLVMAPYPMYVEMTNLAEPKPHMY